MSQSDALPGTPGLLLLALLVAVPVAGTRALPDAGRNSGGPSPAAWTAPRADTLFADERRRALVRAVSDSTIASRRVLLMLLPDPDASSLDWVFDSNLSALRRAMEGAGYVADRYWLPRTGHTVAVGSGVEGTAEGGSLPESEAVPGLLVFRGPGLDSLAVVVTVGELPTAGVHREALRRALDLASSLSRSDTIDIVGPTFSGSVPSLRAVLRDWVAAGEEREPGGSPPCFRIVSGSATSTGNPERLGAHGCAASGAPGAPRIEFRTTLYDDGALHDAVERVLHEHLCVGRDQVAFLVEATAYGLQTSPSEGRTAVSDAAGGSCGHRDGEDGDGSVRHLHIPFPLNIASLREEYARNPAEAESLPGAPARTRPRLPLSLRSRPREAAPSRSPLTPPTVDLVLEDIVATLRDHDVKAVGILASDIRDKLFLGEALRRRMPGLHLFTFEGNALLRRPDFAPLLRGMMVASTYPLILEHQEWTASERDGSLVPFPNEGAAGTFNAVAYLLGKPGLMRGYRGLGPRGTTLTGTPQIWLSAVGRDRLVPLRVFDPQELYPPGRDSARAEAVAALLGAGPPGRSLDAAGHDHRHRTGTLDAALALLAALSLVTVVFLISPAAVRIPWALGVGRDRWRTIAVAPARARGLAVASVGGATGISLLLMAPLGGGGRSLTTPFSGGGDWFVSVVALSVLIAVGVRLGRRSWASPWLRRSTVSTMGVAVLATAAPVAYLHAHVALWEAPTAWTATASWWALGAAGAACMVVLSLTLVWGGAVHCAPEGAEPGKTGPTSSRRPDWQRLGTWLGEHLPHLLALGLGAFTTAFLFQLHDLRMADPRAFALYRFRSLTLDSGLSIVPVFLLATLGVLLGLAWARERVKLLERRRPLGRIEWSREILGKEAELDEQDPPPWADAFGRAALSVRTIDRRLRNVGAPLAAALFPTLLVVFWPYRIRTLESVAFGELAWSSVLLWASVLTGLTVITAAVIQLVLVWHPLRRGLRAVSETPLAHAFDRLPPRLRDLGRLHVFDPVVEEHGRGLARSGYRSLRAAMKRAEAEERAEAKQAEAARAGQQVPGAEAPPERRRPTPGAPVGDGEDDPRGALVPLALALHSAWSEDEDGVWRSAMGREKKEGGGTGDARDASDRSRAWRPIAEEVAAIEIAGHVDWVLRHLRRTALLLLLTILLTTAALEAVPLPYHDVVTRVFMVLVAAAVLVLFFVMASLAQDDVLSRINGTPPGKLSWSLGSLMNASLFLALPVLAILGTEVPVVGRALFSWVVVLLRAFNGA